MKQLRTYKGDIFSVKINESHKKFFQYVANDLLQLNSDVILAFKKVYPANAVPDLAEVVIDEVEFVTHCIVRSGLKLNLWEKI